MSLGLATRAETADRFSDAALLATETATDHVTLRQAPAGRRPETRETSLWSDGFWTVEHHENNGVVPGDADEVGQLYSTGPPITVSLRWAVTSMSKSDAGFWRSKAQETPPAESTVATQLRT